MPSGGLAMGGTLEVSPVVAGEFAEGIPAHWYSINHARNRQPFLPESELEPPHQHVSTEVSVCDMYYISTVCLLHLMVVLVSTAMAEPVGSVPHSSPRPYAASGELQRDEQPIDHTSTYSSVSSSYGTDTKVTYVEWDPDEMGEVGGQPLTRRTSRR